MTAEEQNLYNALITTFNGNLRFLSQYDYPLFERVNMLSDAINSGAYNERYFLEFVKENGDFDIYDSNTKTYIYDKKPKQWNNKLVVNTNLDLKGALTFLNPVPYNQHNVDLSEKDLHLTQKFEIRTMTDIQNFKMILNPDLSNGDKKIKSFNKFVFLGTLLGRHIPKILKKLNFKNTFVCEHNLEIFRLSLFVCDYSLLARDGRSVVFSIMDDENVFMDKFRIFFQNDITHNLFFKYVSTDYNVKDYLDLLVSSVTSRDPFVFNYNLILSNMIKNSLSKIKHHKTLRLSPNMKDDIFGNLPVLFLGAGPSLGKNIKWVKENQDKFIIVAMGATLKRLSSQGIRPDIITSLDPAQNAILQQFNVEESIYSEAVKLVATNTDDLVLNKLSKGNSRLFLFEIFKSFYPNCIGLSGLSIGEVTISLLLLLNAKQIFLLGTDLAFEQSSGDTHDEHSESVGKKTFNLDEQHLLNTSLDKTNRYSFRDDVVITKGNLKPYVKTSRVFYASLNEYNSFISLYKKQDQIIYNLCEDGAFIENTVPLSINDFKLEFASIDKDRLLLNLDTTLNHMCSVDNIETQFDKVNLEIAAVDYVLHNINEFEVLKIEKYDLLDKFASNIMYDLMKFVGSDSFLPELYLNYYNIINNYIAFAFNDKDIKQESKLIKDVQYKWCILTKHLFEEYKKYLQEFIS
ncbi:MAG: DUF115 domain-containing protein [Arcobacteraceae bacterium]|jgi:hypothetical protein|nr:DUF115 domain-containing protein [Arcobacteraceae bacterium]